MYDVWKSDKINKIIYTKIRLEIYKALFVHESAIMWDSKHYNTCFTDWSGVFTNGSTK